MKGLYRVVGFFISLALLSGCASSVNKPAAQPAAKRTAQIKNNLASPLAIQVYPKGARLTHPYKVIAKGQVSKYNISGIKRQEASIHDALRTLAASVGGDAVINVVNDKHHVNGTIVAFETA